MRRTPDDDSIKHNPIMNPAAYAVVQDRYPNIKWHSHADSPDSSQVFALSAFLPLLTMECKDKIITEFVRRIFPVACISDEATWEIVPEFTAGDLLGETGIGEPTNVDMLLRSAEAVICVESKYRVDAVEGFGKCRQPSTGACKGFHGDGSDAKGNTDAWCRLGVQDGRRNPRRYWELAKDCLQPQALTEQHDGDVCPLLHRYQIARNFLLARELAKQDDILFFGAIGIAPTSTVGTIAGQIDSFSDEVLLPEFSDRVVSATYEDYFSVLHNSGDVEARNISDFLSPHLAASAI